MRFTGVVMKKMNLVLFVCIGGLLTALGVLFQSAPILLPMVGLVLSPFSTLPIALAAMANVYLGCSVFFSCAFILTFISVQEAMILLFTTGLLGLVMGALLYRKGVLISILLSSLALSLGMMFLTYVVGVSGFVEMTSSLSTLLAYIIFYLFSIVYASLWNFGLRKFLNYLAKIKVLTK